MIDALTRRRYRALDPGDGAIARYVHRLTIDPGGLAEEDIEDLARSASATARSWT